LGKIFYHEWTRTDTNGKKEFSNANKFTHKEGLSNSLKRTVALA